MPPKKSMDLMNEKVVIVTSVRANLEKNSLKNTDPQKYAKNVLAMSRACALTKEQLAEPGAREKVEALADLIENAKARYERDVKVLSLYKAAVISDRKLQESGAVTSEVKELSRVNLRFYESEMLKAGIEPEVITASLIYPDFDVRIQSYYGKSLHLSLTEAAAENGWEYHPVDAVTESTFVRVTGEDTRLVANNDPLMPDEDAAVYESFAKTGVPYFDNFKNAELPYSLTEPEEFKCFEFRDGAYVPKAYPKGFFAKIGYFFTKLGNESRERRLIEQEKSFAAGEISAVPEEIRGAKLLSDLEDLHPTAEEQKSLENALEADASLIEKFLEQQKVAEPDPAEAVAEGPVTEGPGLEQID